MSVLMEVVFAVVLILMIAEIAELFYRFILQRNVMLPGRGYNLILACVMIFIGIIAIVHFIWYLPAQKNETQTIDSYLIIAVIYFFMVRFVVAQTTALKHRTIEILETIVGLIEAGDLNLKGHSLHVLNLTMLFYDYLPLQYRLRVNEDDLKLAALFLDLGKLGIPRDILNKTGKLSREEYEIIKHHPEFGAKILNSIGNFEKITDWILYHHERFDGSGYHHLKGSEIPLASRIIALTDTYSALIMDRSYKASMTYEDAIAELRLVTDTQLDGELVGYFCEIPKSKINACLNDVKRKMEIFTVNVN